MESIFPSQNPQALVRQEAPETEEQKREREEAKWDISKITTVAQTWDKTNTIISLHVDDRHGYIIRLVSHHGKLIPCPNETIDELTGTSDRNSLAGRSPLRSCLQRAQRRELALTRQGQCPEDGRQIRSRGALMTSETAVHFHRTAFIHSTHSSSL